MLEGSADSSVSQPSDMTQPACKSVWPPASGWAAGMRSLLHLATTLLSCTQLIVCQCTLSSPAHVNVVVKMSTSPIFSLAASSSMPTLATWGEENTTLATLS